MAEERKIFPTLSVYFILCLCDALFECCYACLTELDDDDDVSDVRVCVFD